MSLMLHRHGSKHALRKTDDKIKLQSPITLQTVTLLFYWCSDGIVGLAQNNVAYALSVQYVHGYLLIKAMMHITGKWFLGILTNC